MDGTGTKNLRIVFTGDTASVVAAFDAVQKKSLETQAKVDSFGKSLDAFGSSSTTVGRQMTTLLTLPIVGVGAAASVMAMKFQQAMTYVRTDAGDTTDNIDKLSQSVLNLAKKSQFSPDELANGLYHLASLGLRGADAINALNTAQQMAAVGGADLESTASALGAALVTGIRGVQDYSSAAGKLDAIVGAGNMRMQDLVSALGTGVLPVFKNAGLSITDFGAALATLTDNGMHADEAATRLKMTVSLMEAPSKKAQKALADIGITSNQLGMDMQTQGLIPALEDLNKHLLDTYGTTAAGRQSIAQALVDMFGGGRSSAAIQTLLDQVQRVQTKFTQINQQGGEFTTKVAEQQATDNAKIKTAWDGIQATLIQLGGQLLPGIAQGFSNIAQAVESVASWFQQLTPLQKTVFGDLIIALAAGGPILIGLGAVAKSIKDIKDLVSSSSDVLGKIGDWGTKNGQKWQDAAANALSGWGSALGQIAGKAADGAKDIGAKAADIASKWASAFQDMIVGATKASGKLITSAADTAKSWISAASDMLKSSAKTAATMAGDAAKSAWSWIKAAHDSEDGVGGSLFKIALKSYESAVKSVGHAIMVGAAWVKNAAVASYAWVTEELPKIIKSFIATSVAAAKEAITSSVAWVKSAAASSYAWVTEELPKIVNSFATTSASAIKEAVISSAAWVKEAAVSSAAWLAATAKVVISYVALKTETIALGIAQAAMWVASGVQAGAYGVIIDAVKTKTAIFQALVASPIAMGSIAVAGALADIYLVYNAVQSVRGAIDAMNAAAASAKNYENAKAQTHDTLLNLSKNGDAGQKARADKLLLQGYATGTSYAAGGLSLVGEYGPELVQLPRGSQVLNKKDTEKVVNNHRSVTIGTIVLGSADAVKEMFSQLDRDNLLVMKGLSPARGL